MVGFPGEIQEDFEELYEFLKEAKFDKLGAFTYSKEEGTPAYNMENQIHHMTKKSRYNKIMKLQQEISKESLKRRIGSKMEVLIENISFDGKYLVGRTRCDVPDIDGVIYIRKTKNNEKNINEFIEAEIVDVKEYDLIGK